MFLTFAARSKFKVYQMDAKSAFLNGKLDEEVYVEQPLGSNRAYESYLFT